MIFFRNNFLRSEKGQSVVEYILLFGVIVTLAFSIFKMDAFRDFIGPNSKFFKTIRDRLEYSYRHGSMKDGGGADDSSSYSGKHETYYNKKKGVTHFFGLRDIYPEN